MQKEASQGETNSSKPQHMYLSVAIRRLIGRFRSATKRGQNVEDVFAPRSLATTELHRISTSPRSAVLLVACIPCLYPCSTRN